MGLFGKKKNEEGYVFSADANNSRYSEWNEQARLSNNPEALTPEQLLGEIAVMDVEDDIEDTELVVDSADGFIGSTSKNLYEKMLGLLNKGSSDDEFEEETEQEENIFADDEEENFFINAGIFGDDEFEDEHFEKITPEQAEAVFDKPNETIVFESETTEDDEPVEEEINLEETIVEEPVIEEETVVETTTQVLEAVEEIAEEEEETSFSVDSSYNPENDAFADFFRSLEQDSSPEEKVVEFNESDKAYSSANDEDTGSVDDLLSRMFGASKSEPVEVSVEVEELAVHTSVDEVIAEVETQEELKIAEVEEVEEDIKILPEIEETEKEAEVSQNDDVEKTRLIDLPESTLHKPRHSLYDNDYTINRKAIDDFFDNADDIEEEPRKKIWGKKDKYEFLDEPEVEEVPETITDVFDDDTDDYESLDDAARFKDELLSKRRSLATRMVISIILTIVMAFFNGSFFMMRGLDLGSFANIANLILLVVTMAINFKSFAGIFKGEFNSDAGVSIAGLIVLIQSIVSIALYDGEGAGLGVLAGLGYCISLIAKRAVCSATLKSLCVIATNETKYAVNVVDDADQAKEIVGNVFEDEDPCLCYSKKTINVKGFIKNWARKTPCDKNIGIQLLIAILLAVIVTAVSFFAISSEVADLLSIFVITFSLSFAPSLYLPYSMPTKVMADGLKYYDSAIGGWNAATALSDCNCVVMKAADLFPAGSVILHKMNPLSANRIDSSIAKAAALTIKAESPLANIFKDIVRDQIGNLPKVEDVKYENKLGLSGWIDEERILLGNRTLLENHNVKTPSLDSERAILSAGYMPVYLAVNGNPCLLFVVQYVADPNVKYELCRLCNAGATVIVNSTDPNVTKRLVCDSFDLYDDCIEMINRNGLNKLREKTKPEESTNGFAAYKDNTCGYLAILSSALRIIGVKTAMTVMHIIGIIVTLAAFLVLLFAKGFLASAVLLSAIFQVVFICIISAIPYIKRP